MPGVIHLHTHVPGITHQHTHVLEGNTSAHTHADELAGSESLNYYFNSEVSSLQALAPNFFFKLIIYLFIVKLINLLILFIYLFNFFAVIVW